MLGPSIKASLYLIVAWPALLNAGNIIGRPLSCGSDPVFTQICSIQGTAVGQLSGYSSGAPFLLGGSKPTNVSSGPPAASGAVGKGQTQTEDTTVLGLKWLGYGAGNFSTSFGKAKFDLEGEGTLHGGTVTNGGAAVGIVVQDYLLFVGDVPAGTRWDYKFSFDANGSSAGGSGLDDTQDRYVTSVALSFPVPGALSTCSNGFSARLNGTFSTQCDVLVPAASFAIVPMTYTISGQLSADNGETTLDATHTFTVASIGLIDVNGNHVDATIYDASGYDYNSDPSAEIPEPTSIVLIGIGLLVFSFHFTKRVTRLSVSEKF